MRFAKSSGSAFAARPLDSPASRTATAMAPSQVFLVRKMRSPCEHATAMVMSRAGGRSLLQWASPCVTQCGHSLNLALVGPATFDRLQLLTRAGHRFLRVRAVSERASTFDATISATPSASLDSPRHHLHMPLFPVAGEPRVSR